MLLIILMKYIHMEILQKQVKIYPIVRVVLKLMEIQLKQIIQLLHIKVILNGIKYNQYQYQNHQHHQNYQYHQNYQHYH